MKETYIVCEGVETCFKDYLTGSPIARLSVFGCVVEVCLKNYWRFYTCVLIRFKGVVKRFLERVLTMIEGRQNLFGQESRVF